MSEPLRRQNEPELMDDKAEAEAYARADFAEVNDAFVDRLLELAGPRETAAAVDLGTGPADIPIPMAARMGLLLRRMPFEQFLTDDWREKMTRIAECKDCGQCRARCPYGLDTPQLLKGMLADYEAFVAGK